MIPINIVKDCNPDTGECWETVVGGCSYGRKCADLAPNGHRIAKCPRFKEQHDGYYCDPIITFEV